MSRRKTTTEAVTPATPEQKASVPAQTNKPKWKPGCGGRIPAFVRREAEQLEALLSSPDTDSQTREDLSDILLELSSNARVYIDHPKLVRGFYLAAIRSFHEMQADGDKDAGGVREALDEMSGVLERITKGEPHDDLVTRYRRDREYEDEAMQAYESQPDDDPCLTELARLCRQLHDLERLPENEATRFQLETQIARLKREVLADEWPELINA